MDSHTKTANELEAVAQLMKTDKRTTIHSITYNDVSSALELNKYLDGSKNEIKQYISSSGDCKILLQTSTQTVCLSKSR
jgi:hypothetical protein